MGTDSLFPDVVTGKPLSDLFMLEQTLHFFQPRGDYFNNICISFGFFFLNSLVRGKEKTSPQSAQRSPMFGPKAWELLTKRQKSCYELQCSAGMEQGSDPYKPSIQI